MLISTMNDKVPKILFPKILGGYTLEDGIYTYSKKKENHYVINYYCSDDISFESLAGNKYIFDLKRNSKGNFTFNLENISNNVFTKRNSPYKVELILCSGGDNKVRKKEEEESTKQQQPLFINLKPFENYELTSDSKKNENFELEIKVPCPSKTLFFKTLQQLYEKYPSFYSFEKSTVIYDEKDDTRQITNHSKMTNVIEKKQTIKHIKEDGVKITLSREETENNKTLKREKFKRIRNRHSFTAFYPNFKKIRIDVTEITFPVEAYEIEIDYTTNSFTKAEKQLYLPKLNELYGDLFRMMNDTPLYFTVSEKNDVVDTFLNKKKKAATVIPALNHPSDLAIEELVTNGRKIEKTHFYSYKANGKTSILKFEKDAIYLFFVNEGTVVSFKKVPRCCNNIKNMRDLEDDFKEEDIYYLGEEIPYENRLDDVSKNPILFVIFDCIDFSDTSLSYGKRYNKWCKNISLSSLSEETAATIKIIVKDIFPVNFDTFYKDEIENTANSESLDYKTDGFILTPINDNSLKIYKIKPFDELGIDFEVNFEDKTLLYGKKEVFNEPNFTVNWDEVKMEIEAKNKWIFNLSFNPIVEFLPSRSSLSTSDIITLSYGRLRNGDKVFPNGRFTVQNVWREITSSSTIYDYLNVDKGVLRLRKLHNIIKSTLLGDINNSVQTPFNIIDIGSGRGGDLSKFANLRFDKLLLVEPDKDNLTELEKRLKANSRINTRNITILNTGGEDKELILRNVSSWSQQQQRNVITSMLSLTFLFNPELYTSFVDVLNSIPNRDSFYFFCFDKTKTIENLKLFGTDNKKDQLYLFEENKYKIIYDKKHSKVFINIDDTIVRDQIEYLVDIEKLATDTAAEKVFVNSSSLLLDKNFPNAFLSKQEIILNNFYIFGKLIYSDEKKKSFTSSSSSHLFFNEEADTHLPKMFIDYMYQIKDFYKENFREFNLSKKKTSSFSPSKKSPLKTIDNNKDVSEIKKLLSSIKKSFPFKNLFYEYTDYINTKAIKKLLPQSAYNNECFPVIITKAFLKMNEILYTYEDKIFKKTDNFKVFLNAELPGSFLSCLYHFFETKKHTLLYDTVKRTLDWTASSLFEGSTFLDDRYGLVKKYPERWLMNSSSFNGDITVFSNLKYIEMFFSTEEKKVHFYTSDVGVGVNEDIAPQEESNFFVNIGQIYSGLVSLKEGGSLLIKTYTFFESYSIALFSLLYRVFEEVKIVKPSTSSKFNSEVYFICFGYNRSVFDSEKEGFEKYIERNLANKSLYETYQLKDDCGRTDIAVGELLKAASEYYFLKQAENLQNFSLVISNYNKLMINVKDFAKYFEKKSEAYTVEWLEKYPIEVCEKEETTNREGDLTITENFRTAENKEYEISGMCSFKVNFDNKYIFEKLKNKPILSSFYKDKRSIFVYDMNLKRKNKCNAVTETIVRYFEKDSSLFYSIIFEIKEEKCFVETLVKSFSFKRVFEREGEKDNKKKEYFEMIF